MKKKKKCPMIMWIILISTLVKERRRKDKLA